MLSVVDALRPPGPVDHRNPRALARRKRRRCAATGRASAPARTRTGRTVTSAPVATCWKPVGCQQARQDVDRLADLFDGCSVGGRRDRPIDEKRAIEHPLGRIDCRWRAAGRPAHPDRTPSSRSGKGGENGARGERTAARARDREPSPRRALRRRWRARGADAAENGDRLLGQLGHRHAGRSVDGVGGDHAKPRLLGRVRSPSSASDANLRAALNTREAARSKTLAMPTVARPDAAGDMAPARRAGLSAVRAVCSDRPVRQPAPTQTSRVLAGRVREINTAGVRATAVPYSTACARMELANRYAFLVSAPRYSVAPSVAASPVLSPNDETPASE